MSSRALPSPLIRRAGRALAGRCPRRRRVRARRTGHADYAVDRAALWDEREPTIFRGELAFIRNETHGGVNQDVLRIGSTTSRSRGTTALVKLPRRAGSLQDPELAAGRVAYIRSDRRGARRDVHVRTLRPHGSDKVVYRARSGGANFANIAGLSLSDTATASTVQLTGPQRFDAAS